LLKNVRSVVSLPSITIDVLVQILCQMCTWRS